MSVLLSGQPHSETWNKSGVPTHRSQGKMKNAVEIIGEFLFGTHNQKSIGPQNIKILLTI